MINRSDLTLYSALVAEPSDSRGRSSGSCDVIVLATEPHKAIRAYDRNGRRDRFVPASTRSAKGVLVARKVWDGRWVPQVISLDDLFTPEAHAAIVARREADRVATAERVAQNERNLLRSVEVVDLLQVMLGSETTSRRRASRYDSGGPSLTLDVLEKVLTMVALLNEDGFAAAQATLAAERQAEIDRRAAWDASFAAARAEQAKVDEAVASIGR